MTMTHDEALPLDTHVPLSIRMLRRFNWLLCAMLRSPLHRALSRDLLVLDYTGRRSGRRYALPLSYAEHDGRLYLCTRNSQWWHNLRGGAAVEVRLRGRRLTARPTVLDAASDEARLGLRLFVGKHPRTGALLYAIPRQPDGQPLQSDVDREVRRSIVVRLALQA